MIDFAQLEVSVNIFQEALARYHAEKVVVYDAAAWASRLLACPRQHAHERRQDEPTHPYLQEKEPGLLHLFEMGNHIEDVWFQILSLSYPCQRQVPVRARGVTGKIDILLRLQDNDGDDSHFYWDVPVEIKYSQVSDPSHLWQLAAYLYAGNYDEGYLIRDRGREQEIVKLVFQDFGYRAENLDGSPYRYGGERFGIAVADLEAKILAHNAAFLRPEDGQLLQPTIGRCCKQEGDYLTPHCPWYANCWGSRELRLETEWEDGVGYLVNQGPDNVRYEIAGDWRRKPERMEAF